MVSMKQHNATIPSQADIEEMERQLTEMKEARENAKKTVLASIKSVDDIPTLLSGEDMIRLMQSLQRRLRAGHRKVRGSPVPPELRHNLEFALQQGEFTLAQLEKIFNLSVSYISRVKHDLGLTKAKHRGQEAISVS